jgi:hypothetical protein
VKCFSSTLDNAGRLASACGTKKKDRNATACSDWS